MAGSHEWRRYFERNARSLLDIPWHAGADLTPADEAAIASSVQEFQAGERSEGRHLYQFAQDYARRTGDHDYVAAIRLFIAEEQRHARDLGRFLALNGIPVVETTFADRVFRRLRNLVPINGNPRRAGPFGPADDVGLEISIAVLVTAELIAKVYYAALREATGSVVLRRLCDQILSDEKAHVEFQIGHLRTLRRTRPAAVQALSGAAQRTLYFGTLLVVWPGHRRAIRRGGLTFGQFWRWCWLEFDEAFGVGRVLSDPAGSREIVERGGNLAVGAAEADQPQHLPLAQRQPGRGGSLAELP